MGFLVSAFVALSLGSMSVLGFDHAHSRWERLLKLYVSQGQYDSSVDYSGLKSEPSALRQYLQELSGVTRQEFDAFSEPQRLAFLINAYNAAAVKLVIDHYPIRSIKDIGDNISGVFSKKTLALLGAERSLEDIEHGMIRKSLTDPRVHFTIACAALSCPRLQNQAYVGSKLDEQIEQATRVFLSDPARNSYDRKANRLQLSLLFDWYKLDFKGGTGTIRRLVAPFLTTTSRQRKAIIEGPAAITFKEFDWTLNDKPKPRKPKWRLDLLKRKQPN